MGKVKAKGMPSTKSEFGKWKPVTLDLDIINDEDMTGFAGLEEITDYETVLTPSRKLSKGDPKSSRKRKHDDVNLESPKDTQRKKKKRQKKKGGVNKTLSTGDHAEDEETAGPDEISEKMRAWDGLFVPDPVLRALYEQGFTSPTPIQALALPSAIRDRMDVLGAAQTGSGKTLAFGIPILHFILEQKSREEVEEKTLLALVLTPTRELAIQVHNHIKAAAKHTSIKVAVVVGGMAPQKQKRVLRKGPEIVVATPGRLWELIEEGDEHLSKISSVRHLVIDEADRMAEKGHFAELQQIVDLIKRNENAKRQTFVFSATLTMTHDVPKRLRFKKKKQKITTQMKLESLMSLLGMQNKPKVIDLSTKIGTADTLLESRIYCETEQKDGYLYYFWLKHPGRTIVFCNSIDCVRRLQSVFELLDCKPLSLHASMQQRQRLKNLDRFKKREQCLLLASDVAARGLDISNVQHVVHYQVPRTAEIYVHRSGRTARASKEGLSLMLISPEEIQLHHKLSKTLKRDKELPEFPVDQGVYASLQERISCARQLDKLQRQLTKSSAQNRWLKQAAEAFEINIEEDKEMSDVMQDSKASRQKEMLKKRLSSLLKKEVSRPGLFTRYPTQSGALVSRETAAPFVKIKKAKRVFKSRR